MIKKTILSVALIFVCLPAFGLWLPQRACADPPQYVTLSYDMRNQTLTVTIKHPSTFTSLHYINRIEIKKNNEPVEKKVYSSQPGKTDFEYVYLLPAAAGDKLEAIVFCNIQGHKTAVVQVQ